MPVFLAADRCCLPGESAGALWDAESVGVVAAVGRRGQGPAVGCCDGAARGAGDVGILVAPVAYPRFPGLLLGHREDALRAVGVGAPLASP